MSFSDSRISFETTTRRQAPTNWKTVANDNKGREVISEVGTDKLYYARTSAGKDHPIYSRDTAPPRRATRPPSLDDRLPRSSDTKPSASSSNGLPSTALTRSGQRNGGGAVQLPDDWDRSNPPPPPRRSLDRRDVFPVIVEESSSMRVADRRMSVTTEVQADLLVRKRIIDRSGTPDDRGPDHSFVASAAPEQSTRRQRDADFMAVREDSYESDVGRRSNSVEHVSVSTQYQGRVEGDREPDFGRGRADPSAQRPVSRSTERNDDKSASSRDPLVHPPALETLHPRRDQSRRPLTDDGIEERDVMVVDHGDEIEVEYGNDVEIVVTQPTPRKLSGHVRSRQHGSRQSSTYTDKHTISVQNQDTAISQSSRTQVNTRQRSPSPAGRGLESIHSRSSHVSRARQESADDREPRQRRPAQDSVLPGEHFAVADHIQPGERRLKAPVVRGLRGLSQASSRRNLPDDALSSARPSHAEYGRPEGGDRVRSERGSRSLGEEFDDSPPQVQPTYHEERSRSSAITHDAPDSSNAGYVRRQDRGNGKRDGSSEEPSRPPQCREIRRPAPSPPRHRQSASRRMAPRNRSASSISSLQSHGRQRQGPSDHRDDSKTGHYPEAR